MNVLAHLALSGEQPMPILLPDRFLQWLLPQTGSEEVDPCNLPAILARLNALAPADAPMLVNLTGDAKMMMLAAFALAMPRGWDFVHWRANAGTPPCTVARYGTH